MLDNMDKKMLAIGAAVELEHTPDTRKAMKIAMDHMKQDPEYYVKLGTAGLIDEPEARRLLKQYLKPKIQEQENRAVTAQRKKELYQSIKTKEMELKNLKSKMATEF